MDLIRDDPSANASGVIGHGERSNSSSNSSLSSKSSWIQLAISISYYPSAPISEA